jgi:hypothetical protein
MRVSTLTTSLTAASLASAVITGITAPSTLAPNNTFSLTLISENYIQSVAYIAVAWGFDLAPAHPGALGPYSDSAYVSPSLSMLVLKNKTRRVLFGKQALLQVAVYSLWGSYHGPQVAIWDVEVMIGDETSGDVVSS